MRLSPFSLAAASVRALNRIGFLLAVATLSLRATETPEAPLLSGRLTSRIPIFAYYVAGYATPSISHTWIGWFEVISRKEITQYQKSQEGRKFLEQFYSRPDLRRSLKWYIPEDLSALAETKDVRSWVTSALSPLRVPYDSTDATVVKDHITEAVQNGISGFIINWEGRETQSDRAAHLVLNTAPDHFKIILLYSFLPATLDAFQEDLFYIDQRFFAHHNYYKIDERPVIILSASTIASFPPSDWIKALGQSYQTTRFQLFGDTATPPGYADLFNGMIVTNLPDFLASPSTFTKTSKENVLAFRSVGRKVCLPVYPGYQRYRAGRVLQPSVPRDEKRFREDLATALALEPDCVVIFSYNDWRSGTAIEPSLQEEDTFLKAVHKVLSAFSLPATP